MNQRFVQVLEKRLKLQMLSATMITMVSDYNVNVLNDHKPNLRCSSGNNFLSTNIF